MRRHWIAWQGQCRASDGKAWITEPLDNGKGEENMKNALTDLNNYLFEQLERLNDDSLSAEELDREMKKAVRSRQGKIREDQVYLLRRL